MAYKATPYTTTKYSPLYILDGREMPLRTSENLKAKNSKENPSHSKRLETLRTSLSPSHNFAKRANSRSQQNRVL